MSHNPYQPPQAELSAKRRAGGKSAGFPVSLLLRWIASFALLADGLWRMVHLAKAWASLADLAHISPLYGPYPWLALNTCMVIAGVLLFLRYKWVYLPIIVHGAVFARMVFPSGRSSLIGPEIYQMWAAELALLGFCLYLSIRGRLR